MKNIKKLSNSIKEVLVIISILTALYLILKLFEDLRIFFGIIMISFGLMSIIWTFIAKYNLSPKSTLRLFTNNFLTCTISLLAFALLRVTSFFMHIPGLVYLEFLFITITFIFFVVASYYIYKLGSEFGFEHESFKIKKILTKNKARS